MNDVFILHYFNHKLQKQTGKQIDTRVWVCAEDEKNKRKLNSRNSLEHPCMIAG
jgi:hypothetical protein